MWIDRYIVIGISLLKSIHPYLQNSVTFPCRIDVNRCFRSKSWFIVQYKSDKIIYKISLLFSYIFNILFELSKISRHNFSRLPFLFHFCVHDKFCFVYWTILWKNSYDQKFTILPSRSEKAGRFEKLLGIARSHSIVTRGSVSLSSAITPHFLFFLNLNGMFF